MLPRRVHVQLRVRVTVMLAMMRCPPERTPLRGARAELIARYESRSGRSMGDVRWYQALALWKIVVFMEGNYRRALAGSVDDPYLTAFGEAIAGLAERAEALTR